MYVLQSVRSGKTLVRTVLREIRTGKMHPEIQNVGRCKQKDRLGLQSHPHISATISALSSYKDSGYCYNAIHRLLTLYRLILP